jgi:hypothetical protein
VGVSIQDNTKPIAILLTARECRAIVAAAALHAAEFEGGDPTREDREDIAALDRVISKMHHAIEGPFKT